MQKNYQQLFSIQSYLILLLMKNCILKPLIICLKLLLFLKTTQRLSKNQSVTSGTAGILGIKINYRVMLTVIVDFEEERVNDQMGSVKHGY